MATNLALDPQLLGGLRSKDTVNQTLKEFIQHRKQKELIGLFGSMSADANYDYKVGRRSIYSSSCLNYNQPL